MEQWTALLIKYAAITAVLYLVLPAGAVAFTTAQLLTVSLILTVVAYILGDRIILPAAGNMVAVVADAMIAAAVLWLASALWPGMYLRWGAIGLSALVIGVAEFFFHRYLIARGLVQPPHADRTSDRQRA